VIVRKALWFLIPAALGALIASQWQDAARYMKIKQMSYGQGHPENVPASGRPAGSHRRQLAQSPAGLTSPGVRRGVFQRCAVTRFASR
jgi:hypothetical protein